MSDHSLFTNTIKPFFKNAIVNKETFMDKARVKLNTVYNTDVNFNMTDTIYRNKKYIGFLEALQYLVFVVIIYYFNPLNIKNKYPMHAAVLTLLVSFLYVILFYFLRAKIDIEQMFPVNSVKPTEGDFLKQIGATFGYFILFMLVIKGIIWVFFNTSALTLFRLFISLFFAICFLGIAYILILEPMMAKAKSSTKPSLLTLLLKIVMYLPCLFLVFLDFLKREFSITTRSVWILLGLEMLFVVLYFVVPVGVQQMSTAKGIQLIKGPVSLNQQQVVGNYEQLYVDARKKSPDDKRIVLLDVGGNDVTQKRQFDYSYGLSFWFYINPQGENTNASYSQYTPLLSYGNKPRVEYNFKLNTLRVMTATGKDDNTSISLATGSGNRPPSHTNVLQEIFKTKDIYYQKWNQMVINYNNGTMDIFLNGSLVGSQGGISPYMSFENITLGHNNGIYGGLANVMYYNNLLSPSTIKWTYKMLRDKEYPLL